VHCLTPQHRLIPLRGTEEPLTSGEPGW